MLEKNNSCAIMQPTYLPWLGYFDLIANVKDFIFLDNVKFNKSSYHHQNKILGINGVILLSVPTRAHKGRMSTLINEVEIDDSKKWRKKHLASISQSYGKYPYYDEVFPHVQNIISGDLRSLSELNVELIKTFSKMLSLKTNFHMASCMENITQDRVQRLIDLCQVQKCASYYSPAGSLDYLDTQKNRMLFDSANISIYFQQFKEISYSQKRQDFESHMSILDILMYCGSEKTKEIINQSFNALEFK